MDVHLVSHTHWDREWYLTREQFRLRLIDLVDRVLELLDAGGGYAFFHLDGQTIVLEDYLEIRPEREEEIRAHIQSGRLLVGPWYVMPDEFLVSGEALVRNLALGHSIARSFGGSMPVGYLPDLFGHVSQMPQILRQFGLDNAILWRGFGGPRAEYWWEAPDGSRVLMMHLPGEGYCNATRIAIVPDRMVERAETVIRREAGRTQCGVVLLMNGVDHVEPQDSIPALVAELEKRDHRIRHSTLPAYVNAVRTAVAADQPDLETIRGELRGGEQYAPLLPGVLSARNYLKQANARVQAALERWAEPLSAWAWMLGARYPDGQLQYAWKVLLENHPHDSICGCSIDEVHEENMSRFARSGQVAEDLIERAATFIARRIRPAAQGSLRAVFFNTSGQARRATVVVGVVDLPFASAEPTRHVDPEALDAPVAFYSKDATLMSATLPDGTPIPLQVLDVSETIAFVKSRFETPWALSARRIRFAVSLDLPACGYTALDLAVGTNGAATAADAGAGAVSAGEDWIENDLLRITVGKDGTAAVHDKRSGRTYHRCGALLDEGDVGDEYNYSPPVRDRRITSSSVRNLSVATAAAGPLRSSLVVRGSLSLPIEASPDRRSRSVDLTPVPFSMEITLDAGAPRAAWRITVDNRVKDHRLRVTFPAGTASVSSVTSDTAFGVIARPAHREAQEVPRVEVAVDSFPFQSFAANGVDGGAAVYAEGLHEYEVLAEDPPTLAITLLRCVGDLSREDLATRKHGHAGPGLVTPGAQCPGVHAFALSFEPLPTAPGPMQLYAGSAALLAPPRMALADASLNGERRIPETASMVSVDAEVTGLVLSACRKTEGRESLTLRVFNPSAVATTATMGAHLHAGEVFVLNLDSARQQALKVAHGAAVLDVGPFAIRTVELVPARTAP